MGDLGPDDDAKFDRPVWKQGIELTERIKQIECANLMSLDERDRLYRDWLTQASLHERDRADLRRRGLIDAEINELPVISADVGYAVVFKGLDGKFVGAQWRLTEGSDGGRYRWHNLKRGKQFPGTNEMPIAVYGTENPSALALVEGTGIKPMLAARRFGVIAVGAAGGNHVSSLVQLEAVLKIFPNLPVRVAVDAGDLINPHVMRRHRRTAETLQGLGREAKFLWWDQFTKDDCDVDEIDATLFNSARLLTIAELEALVPNHTIQSETQNQQRESSERDRRIQKRRMQFNQYWEGGLKHDFQLSPIVAGVTTQVEYEGFFPTLDLNPAATILIQGWLGAGKTESMLASTISIKEKRAIVASTPANGLNRQFAERAKRKGFDAMHYQDDVSLHRRMLECDQPGLYLACPDSFKPYAVRDIAWSTKSWSSMSSQAFVKRSSTNQSKSISLMRSPSASS
jgi:hypothetical protein